MKHILLVFFALVSVAVSAQDKFKVLAIRGSVTNGSKNLSVGAKLKPSDRIVIGRGGYASLAHINGRTVELKKEGSFKISDLDKQATKKTGAVSGKFATYVYNELTEVEEPLAFKDTHRSNMKRTGSVERALGDEVNVWDSIAAASGVGGPGELQALGMVGSLSMANGTAFVAIMPRHSRLYSDTVTFQWHRSPKVQDYRIVVLDKDDRVVVTRETRDTVMTVNVREAGLKAGQTYQWYVENVAEKSYRTDPYLLWLVEGAEGATIRDVLTEIDNDFDADDAVACLVRATACEDLGLVYDAWRSYRRAIELASDVKNYKRLYAEFLNRHGLVADAWEVYR